MTVECERTFTFPIADSATASFIDLAQCLSLVNRKLYRQGRCYYVQHVQWMSAGNLAAEKTSSKVTLCTLPYNWVSRNAWVKAFSLWNTMQKKVLKDNPSVQGKWHDFKAFFDTDHVAGGFASAGPTLNLKPLDCAMGAVKDGEWYMSTLVLPQHDVDPGTGVVKAADEFKVHMLGPDVGGPLPTALDSGGIIKMYEDTRARVQIAPDVPGDMSLSWGTQLTDDGSQEPELADLIEDMNDNPPYDLDEYPGGESNYRGGVIQTQMVCTVANQVDKQFIGFPVPLGLLKVEKGLVDDDSGGLLVITLAPGSYQGVLATGVKQ